MAAGEHDQSAPDVLQPGPHRSEQPGSRLHGRRRPAHDDRRRPRRWRPTRRSSIHDDIHAIWINPANSESRPDRRRRRRRACRTTWRGPGSQHPEPAAGALLPRRAYDMETPYNVCGGLQDNYNWCGPSASRFTRGIMNSDWFQVQGGDGFVAHPRSARLAHRLQRVAGRQHPAQEQGHRRVAQHPAELRRTCRRRRPKARCRSASTGTRR